MPGAPSNDETLDDERARLAAARVSLRTMRARTEALDVAAAGNWVSREYLASTFALRRAALTDDPTVPLFFGRVDYLPDQAELGGLSFHVGRRHIKDADGDPLVVDWRAPVSVPFYRATRGEPLGIGLRRRFGFAHGELTGYEDESLLPDAAAQEFSAVLQAEIERPRVGPMRDIVATIQPEQDRIVRTDLAQSVCIQGAPGTGKTAVGLHRAAYLLYAYRDQLRRQGVLVVGPNTAFLRYIGDVLPALGEIDARQTTIDELVTGTLVSAHPKAAVRCPDETPAIALLKGDARLAAVLHRAVWSAVGRPSEGLLVPRGSSRWRVPSYEVAEIIDRLRSRGVRYGAARAMLPQSLANAVLVKMEHAGDSPDDRVQDAVARSRPVKAYAEAVWPAVDPARLVLRLLTDADFLAESARDLLTDEEQRLLLSRSPGRAPASAKWSLADVVLIDETADLVVRQGAVGHVVVDEAQDLSPMMLRAVGRRCSTGSLTVLGDLAQATTVSGVDSWPVALAHLGKPDAVIDELTRGFRVPGEVISYAARLLPLIAPDLTPPVSVRRTAGELQLVHGGLADLRTQAVTALDRIGSVGVIVPDSMLTRVLAALDGLALAVVGQVVTDDEPEFDARLDVVPAALAKGLEFDHVLLLEPAAIAAGESDEVTGLRRLYVCLTRAVTSLVILHEQELPAALS